MQLGTGPRSASNRGGKRAPAKAKASKRRVTKPRVPRVADLEAEFAERESEAASRAPRDYVTSNAVANITAKPKRRRGKKASFRHESYGKVPDYIIERRLAEQKAREVEEANRPDPDVPPGLTLMPEEERLETLRLLEESTQALPFKLRLCRGRNGLPAMLWVWFPFFFVLQPTICNQKFVPTQTRMR